MLQNKMNTGTEDLKSPSTSFVIKSDENVAQQVSSKPV